MARGLNASEKTFLVETQVELWFVTTAKNIESSWFSQQQVTIVVSDNDNITISTNITKIKHQSLPFIPSSHTRVRRAGFQGMASREQMQIPESLGLFVL